MGEPFRGWDGFCAASGERGSRDLHPVCGSACHGAGKWVAAGTGVQGFAGGATRSARRLAGLGAAERRFFRAGRFDCDRCLDNRSACGDAVGEQGVPSGDDRCWGVDRRRQDGSDFKSSGCGNFDRLRLGGLRRCGLSAHAGSSSSSEHAGGQGVYLPDFGGPVSDLLRSNRSARGACSGFCERDHQRHAHHVGQLPGRLEREQFSREGDRGVGDVCASGASRDRRYIECSRPGGQCVLLPDCRNRDRFELQRHGAAQRAELEYADRFDLGDSRVSGHRFCGARS